MSRKQTYQHLISTDVFKTRTKIKEFKKGEHSTAEWLLWIKYNLTEAKYYFSEFKAQSDPLNKLYLIAIQAILCIAQNGGDEKTLKIALH